MAEVEALDLSSRWTLVHERLDLEYGDVFTLSMIRNSLTSKWDDRTGLFNPLGCPREH